MRYRSHTPFSRYVWLYLILTLLAPFLTSLPLIGSVAILNNWWSAIPVMNYWQGYQLGIVGFALGLPVYSSIYYFTAWMLD